LWGVDPVEERARELSIVGRNPLALAKLHELRVVAHVDHPEWIIVPDAQGNLTRRTFQVLDMQSPAARRVKEDLQRFLEHLGGREADRIQISEAPGKQVGPTCRHEPLVEYPLNPLDTPRAIGHVA
jgi:hypothetical protein